MVVDLTGKSSMTDFLVIASGGSARQVGAMAETLRRNVLEAGGPKVDPEGVPACDWVVMDAGDVIVHLFRPEVRTYYSIEELWNLKTPVRNPALPLTG